MVKHSCDNRKCFETSHLSSGTQKENALEARLKRKEYNKPCKLGHSVEYTKEGFRKNCKVCTKISTRAYRRRLRRLNASKTEELG